VGEGDPRSVDRVPLAKSGDYDRQMIIGEFSLKHKNYKASGLIVEGTTGL
jgi:hypothetical protein